MWSSLETGRNVIQSTEEGSAWGKERLRAFEWGEDRMPVDKGDGFVWLVAANIIFTYIFVHFACDGFEEQQQIALLSPQLKVF